MFFRGNSLFVQFFIHLQVILKNILMRYIVKFLFVIFLTFSFHACKKELNLNAEWKDVTVVYGLLNQNDTIHYIKITKAFLGPGNALEYAKIPDSSNYAKQLTVYMEEWESHTLKNTYILDTTTITNKDSGFFYFPDQLVYFYEAMLNENYIYKLRIKKSDSLPEVYSETPLIHDFKIIKPTALQKVSFIPDKNANVEFISAEGGKRYQLTIRFHYLEALKADPSQIVENAIDWIVVNDLKSNDDQGGQDIEYYFPSNGFYSFVHASIPVNPDVTRTARYFDYIFSVAADNLNTYLEVTEPSISIVQEKPAYTNIENGIGLFSSLFVKVRDSLQPSDETKAELKVNPLTKDLGF